MHPDDNDLDPTPGEPVRRRTGARHRRLVIGAGVAVALVLASCSAGDDDATPTSDAVTPQRCGEVTPGALTVGTVLPVTGPLRQLGPPTIEAVNLAVCEINAAGGVNGDPVGVVEADSGTDEATAAAAIDRVVDGGATAIVGPASSRVSLAVADKVTELGVVECSPTAGASSLSDHDDDGLFFRTAPPDRLQGSALAEVIHSRDHERVVVAALDDTYGTTLAGALSAALTDAGLDVVDVAFEPTGDSIDLVLDALTDEDPDAVAIVALPDSGGPLLGAMIDAGVGPADMPVFVTDGMKDEHLHEQVGTAGPAATAGITGTVASAAPAAGSTRFSDAFGAHAPGTSQLYAAHAYDCAVVIALAAAEAGSNDARGIADHIVAVTTDGAPCSRFDECRDLIESGEDIAYVGASGPLDLTDVGEPNSGTYDVYRFDQAGRAVIEDAVTVSG